MTDGQKRKCENILIATLDQDHARAAEIFEHLGPVERDELGGWLTGHRDIRDAPDWVRAAVQFLACIGLSEVGIRRARQLDAS